EDAEIVQAFAQQAAIVINNARQYQFQSEQAGFLMRLEQSLVTISSAVDKKETMNRVAQTASLLMSCEMAGVALYDQEREEIYALQDAGFTGVPDDYVRSFRFKLDHSGGRVLREKKVFTSNDAGEDRLSIFGERLIRTVGARGVIAAPLLVGEHVVGVLYSGSRTPREWTESTQAFFSILANHAAIAIRNAELLDARKRRAQLLDLLSHLSIAGQLTNDLEVIYNILLTAVTAEYGLRFNRAMILLYNKERNSLVGFTGIGQIDRSEAQRVWEGLDERSHSFDAYIQDVLARGILHYTTLHFKAKNLEIPVRAESNEVFSRVYRTGSLLVVDPAREGEAINSDFYHLFEPGPFVLAPLVVNGEVVGMLVADNKINGEPIRLMEQELLESCASQAAAAVYRSNLHKQVEERVHVMEHLQELAQAFSELAEPRDEVLRRIAQATNEILHADIAYLAPYDFDKEELLVEEAVTAGAKTDFQHEGTFSKHGLTALAMQEPSGLVVIEDLEARKDLSSRFADREGVRSVAVCRLELRKKIVGMLYINYRRYHWFSEFELNTLRMLAGQAAVAISNAHLMQQNESLATQRERSRLRDDLHDVLNTYAFKVMEPAESIFEKEKAKRRRDPRLVEESEELWRFSRHTYQQLVRILEDMRDPVLVEHGLPEAVRSLVASSKLPGVELTIHGEVRPSADVELALYRICQEAISNIRKHARLPEQGNGLVSISLDLEGSQCCLEVGDHGVGFSAEIVNDRRKGMGLQALHNWTRKVGGQIDIRPIPGEGTQIRVVVPHYNPQEREK
ncbi:MAG TPA: GAF domain-containing protein, partial [Anaerolineales bacterium]